MYCHIKIEQSLIIIRHMFRRIICKKMIPDNSKELPFAFFTLCIKIKGNMHNIIEIFALINTAYVVCFSLHFSDFLECFYKILLTMFLIFAHYALRKVPEIGNVP